MADEQLSSDPDVEEDTDGTLGDIETNEDDDMVIINVGGIRHETLVSTLQSKPRTRLSHLANKYKRGSSVAMRKKEYFFDRHPGVFNTVMDYYRSGELHVPLDVCGAVVKRELDYWRIDDTLIEPCCWTSYSSYIDNQKTLSDFNKTVDLELEELSRLQSLTGWRRKQYKIWMILDHPRSSRVALIYAVASFLFVLASITGFCIETLPGVSTIKNRSAAECNSSETENNTFVEAHPSLLHLDYICTAFFTLELFVRIIFAPDKREFFKSLMNIIDILALLPLYVQVTLTLLDPMDCLRNHRAVLETIFILRIIRIFRIFHLVKHYKALKILVHAIRASIQELLMLSIFLVIAMLVFATLIFYAERDMEHPKDNDFRTIPIGFYWSIITMTTVGYGDVYPNTALGYVIGALCGVCGVLLLALTIPVLSNNFALFYLHARTREEIARKDKDAATWLPRAESNKASIKNKSSEPADKKAGVDTRALLVSAESSSITDEAGIMMTNKNSQQNTTNCDKLDTVSVSKGGTTLENTHAKEETNV